MLSIHRVLLPLALTVLATTAHHAAFAQGAMVGILEGKATLIRQTAKLALAEGVALQNEDIVETEPASFVQIEFTDGGRIGIGPDTRLALSPRASRPGVAGPRVYMLKGWVKLTQPADRPTSGDHLTPHFSFTAVSGATILASSPEQLSAFVESGSVTLGERSGERPPVQLGSGDFFSAKGGDKPVTAKRAAPDFIAQMPRPFRDPLPLRAAKLRANPVAPKPLGEVAYEDIAAWLTAEPGLRLPMVQRWRPRLKDKAFRAAMIGQLASHPEWDPLLFPEKEARRKAEEKRQRELKAAAAAQAAAAEASAKGGSAPKAPD